MGNVVESRFVCPGCAQEVEVDAAMREAIIDAGCAICGAAVTAEAFSRGSARLESGTVRRPGRRS